MSEVETLRAHGTHVRGVRERLRLVFGTEPPVCDAGPVPPALPWVEFMAFTEDSRVSGHIQLDCDRLSDTLNAHRDFLLCDVRVECLEDGRSVHSAEVPIARDELIAVLAGDPRGDPARRIHTLTHPVTVEAGPSPHPRLPACPARDGAARLGPPAAAHDPALRRMDRVPLGRRQAGDFLWDHRGEPRHGRLDAARLYRAARRPGHGYDGSSDRHANRERWGSIAHLTLARGAVAGD